MALIVIHRFIVEVGRRAGFVAGQSAGEAANDGAALLGNLVGIGEMELATACDLRRTQSHLPGTHQSAIDGDGEEHVRLAEVGVVKEVVDAVLHVGDVEQPALEGNLNTELMFFVALGRQRCERVFAFSQVRCVVQHRGGNGLERRGLEEVSIKTAQDPVQAGDFNGGSDARIDCRLIEVGTDDGETLATEDGYVAAEVEVVRDIKLEQAGAGVCRGVGE